MLTSIKGKSVIVTGGSKGIGRGIASVFAKQGAKVTLAARGEEALKKAAAEMGDNVRYEICDVSDWDSVKRMVDSTAKAQGGIDIMCVNAGYFPQTKMIDMDPEEWDSVIQVNLTATFHLMRAAVARMMRRRSGRIINITSVVGTIGNPGQGNYCAAKAGIVGMSKSLAYEVASRNITVNCIAPGFISTAMTDVLNDKQREAILGRVPAGRLGTPDEVAAAALYLASDAASYVTGQTLHVNGGMAMV